MIMNRLSAIKIANTGWRKEDKPLLNRDQFTSIKDKAKKEQNPVPELIKALAETKKGDKAATNVYEVI